MTGMRDGNGPTVARLAMIDVTWAYCRFGPREQPEEQVWHRYHSLLCELLDFDSPGGAWILHNPQLAEVQRAVKEVGSNDPVLKPYEWFNEQEPQHQHCADPTTCLPGPADKLRWHSGAAAKRTVNRVTKGLKQCRRVSTRAWMEHQEPLLAAQMNLFACRLYLNPERTCAKLVPKEDPSALPAPAHACVDFRFQEHLGRYWLYATLSLWTHKPKSKELAPPDLPTDETGEGPHWRTLRAGFKERVDRHFHPAEMKILDREHQSPQLWIVLNAGFRATSKTVDDLLGDLKARVGELLGTPDIDSNGVAASVMEGTMLTLRRFVPGDHRKPKPTFLRYVVMGGATVEEEDKAWHLTQELTDLEAFTAAQLFDVVTDLDIYSDHLKVYEAVANQADAFWDHLALYLPRWRRLIRVHKLIELVHQTLLQGIADLDQAAILANDALWSAEQLTADVRDEFDRTFTEQPLQGASPIRSSLTGTETGYLDDATREAKRVVQRAEQVRRSYQTLLEGITQAFDERRVRGTDVLEHVGFALALLVVVFSFLPEALNAVFADWIKSSEMRVILNNLTIAGIVGLLLAGFWVLWRRWQLGILGSWRFRERHNQVREFLDDCKTDHLTRFREVGWKRAQETLDDQSMDETPAWDTFFDEWDKRDRELAHECAALLDELASDKIRDKIRESIAIWNRNPQLKDLPRQVEQWSLKALLVSERPREFWKFPLPRLTFLYRFYPMMGDELLLSSIEAAELDIVSDADLKFTIITRCSGSGNRDEINRIQRWAQRQIGPPGSPSQISAKRFVNALDSVGLKAGMTRKEFKDMLNRMDEQLQQA